MGMESDNTYLLMGMAYRDNKDYDKSIKSLKNAVKINSDLSYLYPDICELQLIRKQPFDKKIEKKYFQYIQKSKDSHKEIKLIKKALLQYELLKVLQDITYNKKVNLEQWKQKYCSVEMDWGF